MPEMPRLSACVIARDEERRLLDCLESLRWCDEVVVVVDSRSTDRTAEIAARHGSRVIEHEWEGFARQRNFAIEQAEGDWILEVDADERIGPVLASQIREFLASRPDVDIAAFPRREVFLGRRLGPAGKYPNYRHRLFRRNAYEHDPERLVHEGLWPRGRVAALSGDMEHLFAETVGEAVSDSFRYARLVAAQSEAPAGARAALAGLLVRPLAKFAYRAVVHSGWRDGWRGMTLMAIDSASDALVTALLLRGPRTGSAPAGGIHFGHATRSSSGRVVGLAAGPRRTELMLRQLQTFSSRGEDVLLVTDAPPAEPGNVEVKQVGKFRPFSVIRALEAEDQLMPVGSAVATGPLAQLMLRLTPRHLRGRTLPPGSR
jgi:hypothetical protein